MRLGRDSTRARSRCSQRCRVRGLHIGAVWSAVTWDRFCQPDPAGVETTRKFGFEGTSRSKRTTPDGVFAVTLVVRNASGLSRWS